MIYVKLKMQSAPVIILVGGTECQKTKFYSHFTAGIYNFPTTKINIRTTINTLPTIVLVDTPGLKENRNPYEYCWEGVFHLATIILNFGNWSPKEIYGTTPTNMPIMMTWSGDHQETMERIINTVQ
jgi:hypothetical protein